MSERVCITGCGVVSPLGRQLGAFWQGLLSKAPPPAPVTGFDASRYRVDLAHQIVGGEDPRGSRARAFALDAAGAALEVSRLDVAKKRVGLSLATTSGGWEAGQLLACAFSAAEEEMSLGRYLGHDGEWTRDASTQAVASALRLSGPVAVPSAACAASAYAITWGVERIQAGEADAVLVGGVDTVTELAYAGFHSVRALAPDACRPFSTGRRGIVLGEGAAVMVLEGERSARRRGAPVLAEVLGYSLSTDTRDMTNPSAAAIERTMAAALEEAGHAPGELDSISAHGTGTRANDRAEGEAIAALLGEEVEQVPVCALKSAIGHTQGAASAFGCVGATMTATTGLRPPLRNYLGADPELPSLRFAQEGDATAGGKGPVLVNAFGFGGATASVVIGCGARRRPGGASRPRARARVRARPKRRVFVTAATALLSELPPDLSRAEIPRLEVAEMAADAGDSPGPLVSRAMRSLLGDGGERGERCGAYLGTFYGSQSIHERAAVALDRSGPAGYPPRDFAVSTYNAPVGAGAMELGLRGPTTAWLGMNAGLGALGAAAGIVALGRCERMVAGGYDAPTPLLATVMRQAFGLEVKGGAALALLSADPEQAGPVEILGWASLPATGLWPGAEEALRLLALLAGADRRGGIDALILDSALSLPGAEPAALLAASALRAATVAVAAPRFGAHRLAAAGPLGVALALEALACGELPADCVLAGSAAAVRPGTTVALLGAGPMTGLDALLLRLL